MGRSGEWVTNLSGEAAYQSFKPSPLPPDPELNISSDIVKKLVEANRDMVVDIKRTATELGVSYNTVSAAVGKLVQAGILRERTNASRNRVFSYEAYLNILRKDT